jgi:ADP-dependent NAD(P)H-hydrate dehydratase / NAD(P)H-hydrate epimerase
MQHLQTRIELSMNKRISEITQKRVSGLLPKRPRDSHKGMFGTVAVIGGASGMIGAPLLASRAALKLGAGCVHTCLLAENAPSVDLQQPELMLHSTAEGFRQLDPDVIAIGCGLGNSKAAYKLLYDALLFKSPLVLDAGALSLFSRNPDLQEYLRTREHPSVLTPHPGEAAHLLTCSTAEIQADRITAVQTLAQQLRCSVVLKGANSLCATSDGKIFVNKTGNPGMSSAGMGDVLTGMIAAFIAQGLSADNAMLLAVHLHGAAGDALSEQGITVGMTAGDVTEWSRWLLNQWFNN